MSDSDGFALTRGRLLLAVVVAVGVVVPGVARRFLGQAGYETLGAAVFVLGYGAMVLFVWYRWIRPLDLTGPSGRDRDDG